MPSAPIPGMARTWEEEAPIRQTEPDLPSVLEQTVGEGQKMTKSQKIELLRESGFYENG